MMIPRTPVRLLLLVGVAALVGAREAGACFAGPRAPETLVRDAEIILRVRASSTEVASARSGIGVEHVVRFIVLEQLKGQHQFDVAARGTLSDQPEMNPGPVPYGSVKRSGLSGACFAETYQKNSEYLLFLKKVDGLLTPYWAPLSATNEQIVGPQDKWVVWVKEELLRAAKAGK
jgi:hypothetical protein